MRKTSWVYWPSIIVSLWDSTSCSHLLSTILSLYMYELNPHNNAMRSDYHPILQMRKQRHGDRGVKYIARSASHIWWWESWDPGFRTKGFSHYITQSTNSSHRNVGATDQGWGQSRGRSPGCREIPRWGRRCPSLGPVPLWPWLSSCLSDCCT